MSPPLAETLLRWYAAHRRTLPWRQDRDPYRVWVSEVMLQQTRVEAAIPYYHTFLRAFPTVEALAAAREQDVLRRWAGLGYYARARHLHRAAREVVRRGGFPTTAAGWRALPGVGPYTAAAVASIAFGEDVVALDANGLRVGLRVLGLRAPTSDRAARAQVEAALRAVLPRGRAGAFNQALMDLGATVCTPRRPRCTVCPVRAFCRAHREGVAESIPPPQRRPAKPLRRFVAALVQDPSGRVLLVRQPRDGLWGGLWTFPYVEARGWPQARRALQQLLGSPLRRCGPALRAEHGFTHFTARFHVVPARCVRPPRVGRFTSSGRPTLPLPAFAARLLRALRGQARVRGERRGLPRLSTGSTRRTGSWRSRFRAPATPRSPGTRPRKRAPRPR